MNREPLYDTSTCRNTALNKNAFKPQFLLNENFTYLNDIAKDTEFFF